MIVCKKSVAGCRAVVPALIVILVLLLSTSAVFAFGESGGSGLVRIEQAYSLPIGRPLVSIYSGYYGNDFTPGTSRLFSFTPSLTLGLGAGFEASGSLRYEGLSTVQDEGLFTHRYETRRRTLTIKARWSSDIGSPRLRAGVLGNVGIPAGEVQRPGGTENPDIDMDRGLMFMTSANLGGLSVPLRLHANVGYWWSRNDGAFYYRDHPFAVDMPGVDPRHNDVIQYGLGLEAGLRRAVIFLELSSEQFVGGRSAIKPGENLWRLTPGFRTQLTSSVGLTGGVAFDVSSNDPETAFDPKDVFPEYEFRLGLTIGSVLSRESHERRRYRVASTGDLVPAEPAVPGSWMVIDHGPVAEDEPVVIIGTPTAEPTPAPTVAPMPMTVVRAPMQPVGRVVDETTVEELERRLDRMETMQRIADVEARLARMESRGLGGPSAEFVVPTEPEPSSAPTAAAVDTTASVVVETGMETTAPQASNDEMQARFDRMLADFEQALGRLTPPAAAPAPAAVQPQATAPTPAAAAPVPATTAAPQPQATAPAPVVSAPASSATVPATPAPQAVVPQQPVPVPVQAVEPAVALEEELTRPYEAPLEDVQLDPDLLKPYVANETPTTTPAPDAVGMPLAPGQRLAYPELDLGVALPFADGGNGVVLEEIVTMMTGHPEMGVAVLVHGGGVDADEARIWSEAQAAALCDFFVAAGVGADQVVPMGLGLNESRVAGPLLELERIR